jgi:hypothetical protein
LKMNMKQQNGHLNMRLIEEQRKRNLKKETILTMKTTLVMGRLCCMILN